MIRKWPQQDAAHKSPLEAEIERLRKQYIGLITVASDHHKARTYAEYQLERAETVIAAARHAHTHPRALEIAISRYDKNDSEDSD